MNIHNLTIKQKNNQPTFIQCKSNRILFLSECNQNKLIKEIYNINKSNGGREGYLYFKINVPILMENWSNNELNLIKNIGNEQISSNVIDFLNQIFIKKVLEITDTYKNPKKSYIDVEYHYGDGFRQKKYENMTVEDLKNIDLPKPDSTYINSSIYRQNNEIPLWQRSVNTRHYDRGNEGLRDIDPSRSSLENKLYKYNMEPIFNASETYKYTEYK